MGLISSIFSVLILGTSFFALNVKLACAILIFGVMSMFVPVIFSKRLNNKNLMYSKSISKFTQKVKEYIVAYPTIKNYAIERTILQKFEEANKEAENRKFDSDYELVFANNVGALFSWFMQFVGVGYGIMLVLNGEILIGTVIAAQSFANDLGLPLQNIITNINSIRSVKEIANRIERLSSEEKGEDKGENKGIVITEKLSCFPNACEIMFDKVNLKINNQVIIDNFTFKFEGGKKYLIVGVNGSGKSSLFKALKKWFKNCSGDILINGCKVDSLKNEEISREISYLSESVSLFSGTVGENISLYRKYETEMLNNAIAAAHIELNLHHEIKDESRNISSGEQRRIEIARSLLKSVGGLIFDEVVSTLDIETAYEIEKMALEFDEKTVIFISHNFSGKLVRLYDEILVMDKGKLVDHGKYDDLIKSCPYFKKICEIKFG